jgi:hypothetical protein
MQIRIFFAAGSKHWPQEPDPDELIGNEPSFAGLRKNISRALWPDMNRQIVYYKENYTKSGIELNWPNEFRYH